MDQAEKPTFSQWQIQLIREALRSYRIFTPDHETGKSPLSWNALRERITVITDVEFGKDDLRQFVEGKKKGNGKVRIPEAHKLRTISEFLVGEEQLNRDTLENQGTLDAHMPLYLGLFLRSADTPEILTPPSSLLGTYEAMSSLEGLAIVVRLSINEGAGSYFSVLETLVAFDEDVDNPIEMLRTTGRDKPDPKSVTISSGWGVVTPEDNILFFQKDIESKENHFWKLGIEEFFWLPEPVRSMYLHRYDWPYSINTANASTDDVQHRYFEHCAPRFLKFQRAE